MHIKKIKSRHRRDMRVVFKCEHCNKEHEGFAYDDEHFHNNVVPDMVCKDCGKKSNGKFGGMTPRYPEGMMV